MKWITIFLTIASICIGLALGALGSTYWGVLLVLAAIIILVSQNINRHSSNTRASTCQKEMSCNAEPQHKSIYFKHSIRRSIFFIIGAASGAALVLMLLLTAPGILPDISSALAGPASEMSADYRALKLFGKVFDLVRADYVDKPDDKKLIASAINGMVTGLDPHSSYLDAKSLNDMEVGTSGEFGGLGMKLTTVNGLIKVVSPIDNTPASKAGILAGDIIMKIDGEPTRGMSFDSVVTKLRGPVGSEVKLNIDRKGQANPIRASLTRETIKVRAVRDRVEGNDVGYIRILQFNNLAGNELKAAIKDISERIPAKQLKGYILDLRNNPGGLLDQAVLVSNAFLKQGEIVSIRGRNPDDSDRFDAKSGDLIHGKPLIVLINGGSASASEIVAGALQDHKRATIIGTRSFGKGSVQTIIPLGQRNGALRLTTARYFTPSGGSIQAQGIMPDIEVKQEASKDKIEIASASEAELPGHLKSQGPEHKGSQAYVPSNPKDDRALQAALTLLRGPEVKSSFPPKLNQAHAS
jgi:carboxyl-terminal processing protease